jgi:hypothetical protein
MAAIQSPPSRPRGDHRDRPAGAWSSPPSDGLGRTDAAVPSVAGIAGLRRRHLRRGDLGVRDERE